MWEIRTPPASARHPAILILGDRHLALVIGLVVTVLGRPPWRGCFRASRVVGSSREGPRSVGERGVKGATIKSIAEEPGVSHGLLRHHFGSKDELRRACDEYALEAFGGWTSSA